MAVVDVAKLRNELAESWRVLGKEDGGGSGVLRACSMTFLVMAVDSDDPQDLGATVAELNHEHPSRTIALRLHEKQSGIMDGRVEVTCWMPAGKRQQICCEQIVLEAAPDTVDQLERVILGLTVPDLPVVTWCRCPESMSASLLRLAHKVIVDGNTRKSGRDATGTLSRLQGSSFVVGDLAWTRITRWREILNQLFLTPRMRGRAGQVRDVEIAYAGREIPATAAYLGGWLKRCLPGIAAVKWTSFAEEATDPAMGRIRSLSVGGEGFQVTLSRPPGVGVDVSMDGVSARVRFPLLKTSELLHEEISVAGRDTIFEESWREAAKLLEMPS